MANFKSSLTGSQLNDALLQVEARIPEGWAVGTNNGVPVSSGSPYYNNNAKYYAAIARAAVPAGTAGAVFFDRAQTLTATQQSQARANIKAGGSNPNLLDNPWFTVNQRQITTLTVTNPAQYCVDRWRTARCTMTTSGDGVSIKYDTEPDYQYGFISQYIGNSDRLTENVVTCSVKYGGTVYSVTGTASKSSTITGIFGDVHILFSWSTAVNAYQFSIRLFNTTAIVLQAAKLEIGTVSTLANDAPPNYAEELAKCRYYYRRIGPSASATLLGMGFIESSGTIATFPSALPRMRTANPTITRTGGLYVRVAGNDTNHSFTEQSASSTDQNTVITLKNVSGVAAGNIVWLVAASGGFLELSADL